MDALPPFPVQCIAVGSTNRPKIEATRLVFTRIWPQARIIPTQVESGVAAQPWGMEAAVQGALNRARRAQAQTQADLGVGLEGSVEEGPCGVLYLTGWAAVVTAEGRWGIGGGGRTPLPPALAESLRAGMELGPAIDQWLQRQGIRHQEGTVGVLTRGLLDRAHSFANTLTHALAALLHPSWYPAWHAPIPDFSDPSSCP